MASLHKSVPGAHLIDARRIPFAGVHAICNHLIISPVTRQFKAGVNSRLKKNEVLLLANHKRGPVSATNPNSSDKLQETKRSDAASGPPFLTILAGVIVFFLVCWIIGSILMWVVGLIVHPPLPK